MRHQYHVLCFIWLVLVVPLLAFAGNARKLSGDELYRSICTRCHAEWPKLSKRRVEVAVRHMRVRANLQMDEAVAIARYLEDKEAAK